MKQVIKTSLAIVLIAGNLTGCSIAKEEADTDHITISIGNWSSETDEQGLKGLNSSKTQMEEKYPNITIIPDTYSYDTKTFTMKAAANQLPTCYPTWFTEIQRIIKDGYAADITEAMKQHGMLDAMNPNVLKIVSDGNGRIYGFPTEVYAQGLAINKDLFKQAGLVNEDGTVKIPDTYQELAEYAKIITEKTGKAGYCIPTINNCGGWHFLNIAWSYGVQFMKQREDGTWEATFNTPEAVAALQYVKDLKWKYHVLPDNTVIDQGEMNRLFATGQAAMIFMPPSNSLQQFGMPVSSLALVRMPAGPAGRYSQMGGNLWMFANNATPEQVDACLKWLEFVGYTTTLDEQQLGNIEKSYQLRLAKGEMILNKNPFPIWNDPERIKKENELAAKYSNIDPKDFDSYYNFQGVTIKPEEPIDCQQLYSVLDKCIQEVITNENADPALEIAKACKDFQTNHLDKENG